MVSGGCVVSGAAVKQSLLFSNVRIDSYTTVTESVILPNAAIGQNCTVTRAIVDSGSIIADGTIIGEDAEADRARGFRVTPSGLTLVTPDMLGQQLHITR
jgi:glucose-1-phosphate adenylyltransferase